MQLYIYDSAWVWIIVFMKISILMSDCKSFCRRPLLIAQFPPLAAASHSNYCAQIGRGDASWVFTIQIEPSWAWLGSCHSLNCTMLLQLLWPMVLHGWDRWFLWGETGVLPLLFGCCWDKHAEKWSGPQLWTWLKWRICQGLTVWSW